MKLEIDWRRRHLTLVGLCAVAVLPVLTGCATESLTRSRPVTSAGPWIGRMSLIVASQPQQSFYAGFTLEGNADAGRLALSSPLGNMLAELIWEPGRAELVEGSKRTEYGSLDDLTNQVTGTQLPVPALFDWLQGKNTVVEGWESDLSALAQGKLSAQRLAPDPTARLRIILTD